MKRRKQIEEMLDRLKRHNTTYGISTQRVIGIKILEWVLRDDVEEEFIKA